MTHSVSLVTVVKYDDPDGDSLIPKTIILYLQSFWADDCDRTLMGTVLMGAVEDLAWLFNRLVLRSSALVCPGLAMFSLVDTIVLVLSDPSLLFLYHLFLMIA